MGIAWGAATQRPGGARLARRARAAAVAGTRLCVVLPCAATAPDPRSKTPLEAPLVDRGARIIGEDFRAGINYFRASYPRYRESFVGWAKARECAPCPRV